MLINLHIYNIFSDGKGQSGFAEEARVIGPVRQVRPCCGLSRFDSLSGLYLFVPSSQYCG